ncbi:MAG: hypothetical protein HYX29_02420 [Solirubrobacterales bacterium]|nr:hypothetical protein [Solirubrobacterales bacterium]
MNGSVTVNRATHDKTRSKGSAFAIAAFATLLCLAVIALNAASAQAAFNVTDFQMDPVTPASTSSPLQAGGHPSVNYRLNPDATLADNSNGDDMKKVTYEFPAGALANPEVAAPKCNATQFSTDKCPSTSYVGSMSIKLRIKSLNGLTITAPGSVYILDPPTPGSAVTVGFIVRPPGYRLIFLKTEVTGVVSVRTGLDADYGLTLNVDNIPRTLTTTWGSSLAATIADITVILNNKTKTDKSGPFFTYMPTRCTNAKTKATIVSYAGVTINKEDNWTPTGCTGASGVQFDPTANVVPSTTVANAPAQWTANFTIPTAAQNIQQSHIKGITVDLPPATQLNGQAISDLPAVCSEAQINADACLANTKIGIVSADVPFLPPNAACNTFNGNTTGRPNMCGDVYVLSKVNGITFGYLVRGPNGVKAQVRGWVRPVDVNTDGQSDFIRAYSENMPQAPYSPAMIKFTNPLVLNPETCGPQTITTKFDGWNGSSKTVTNSYTTTDCGPTIPDTTITGGPNGPTNDNTPTFTFTASPATGATFEARLNGGAWTTVTSPYTLSTLADDSSYTLEVRACSTSGCDASAATRSFSVDTVAPALAITAPAAGALLNSTAVSITFTNESGAGVTCAIDGGAASACSSPRVYTGLAQGAHTVTVVATDAAGNTTTQSRSFSVDSVAPTVTGSFVPSGTGATGTFSFNETVTGVTCKLNTEASASPCSSPKSYSGLANGNYTVTVSGTDAAGNVGTGVFAFTISVDTTPPDTTITSGPSGLTALTSASFAFTSNEAGGTFRCSLDGAPETVCTSPVSYTGLAQGAHTVSVRAVDAATNQDPTPATRSWTVDTVPPSLAITSPAEGFTFPTSAVSISFTAEAGSTTTCQLNTEATASSCTSPRTYSLANGAYTVTVRATDAAGNVATAPRGFNVGADVTPPDTTITSGPNGPVNTTSASFAFTSSEAGSTFTCKLDAAAAVACTSPVSYSGLSQGAHTVTVTATDAAGNTDPSPATRSWTIDTSPPSAPTLNGPSGTVSSTSASITVSGTEAGASLQGSLDGGLFATVASPIALSGLGEGSHTYCVRQTDTAGNVGAPACVTWTVDTVAPAAPTLAGPTGTVSVNTATITITAAEAGGTLQGSLDGAAFATVTSPVNLTGLSNGSHTYSARQVDAAGNLGAVASITWTVNTSVPATPTINTGPTGSVNSTSASFTFSTAESGMTFECSLDGAAYTACTSPQAYSSLANGSHTFNVRAKNGVGTTGGSATRTWTVDTVAPNAPTVSRTAPTANPTNSTSQTIGITPAEAGGTLQGSLDGAAYATVSSPVNLTGLTSGSHTYNVRQLDAAGNIGAVGSVTWTVDLVAPLAPTVSGPTGTVAVNTATITITPAEAGGTLQGSLDGAAFATVTSPVNLTGLGNGSHTYSARQVDAAGNLGAVASITWTVNSSVPATPTINSGPTGSVSSTSASFTFSTAESGMTFECSLDGAAYTACTSPQAYSSLAQGSHTFAVRAKNAANTTGGSATRTWTVDTVIPAAPTLSGVTGTVATTNATITITPAEAGGTLQGSLDGAAYATVTSPVNLTGLSQGSHTYSARQVDAAGNVGSVGTITWTADTVAPLAPTVSRTAPTATPTNSTTQTISITGAEAGSTFQGSLDGAAYATVTSPVNLTGVTNGTHTYSARQIDSAGNVGAVASVTWTVDTVAPLAPSVTGPSGTSASQNATITITPAEAGGTLQGSLDGAAYATVTSPVNLTGLSNGSHTYSARQVDGVGNVGAVGSLTWTVDTSAFTAAIATGPSGTVASQSATFTYTSTLAGSTFQCSLDGAAFASCPTGGQSYTALAQGSHTFQVRAINGAQTSTVASRTWTVDTVGPVVSITSPAAASTTGPNATLSFTATDGTSPVTATCQLDGNAPAACSSGVNVSYTGLSNGSHTITVTATDGVSNNTVATRTWTVDAAGPAAPTLARTVPSANPSNSTSQTITITPAEAGGTIEGSLDGAAYAPATSPVNLTGLSQGGHTYTARQIDGFGNVGAVGTVTWTVDSIAPNAPTVARTAPTADPSNSTSQTITVTPAEAGGTLQGSLDGAAYATVTSPVNLTGLSQGSHTYNARQVDAAGNVGAVGTVTWTVDSVAPLAPTCGTTPSGPIVASTSITINCTPAEAGGQMQGSLDGAAFANVTFPVSLSSLSQGSHTYSARQLDAAGNVGAVATVTWTVDTVAPLAPTVTRTAPTASPTNSTTQTIGITPAEAGGTLQGSLDGAAYATVTSPVNLTGCGWFCDLDG